LIQHDNDSLIVDRFS